MNSASRLCCSFPNLFSSVFICVHLWLQGLTLAARADKIRSLCEQEGSWLKARLILQAS